MCYIDLGTTEALMELNLRETEQRTTHHRLVRTANSTHRQRVPGQTFRLVHQIGRTLSALGQRLEQTGLPQASRH